MIAKAMLLLCVAACTVFVWTAPVSAEEGFVGELTGTNVYVRSNSRDSAYPCTKLSMPARVTVVGHVPGWYKILPPPGVFSVIAKDYVRRDEGGASGEVTGDHVWVRAGGELRDSDFWSLQTQLNTGDKVQITGEVQEYYKITPPAEAYFWISDRYVKSAGDKPLPAATAEEPKEVAEAPKAETAAAGEAEVVMPEVRSEAPATEAAATPPAIPHEQLASALDAYKAAEADLRAEFAKAPEDRNLDGLIEKFKAIDLPEDDKNIRPAVEYWIAYVEAAKQRRVGAAEFQDVMTGAEARRREYDLKRTAIEVGRAERQPVLYAAKGVLQPSVIYTGGAAAPKRFVLRNPETGGVEAYAQCTTGEVRLESYIGQNVGVMGSTRYVPELRAVIVEAQQVSILEGSVTLPEPPKPTVQPLPAAPAPKASPTKPAEEPKAVTPAPAAPAPKAPAKPQTKTDAEPQPVAAAPTEAPKPAASVKPTPAAAKPTPTVETAAKADQPDFEAATVEPTAGETPAVAAKKLAKADAPAAEKTATSQPAVEETEMSAAEKLAAADAAAEKPAPAATSQPASDATSQPAVAKASKPGKAVIVSKPLPPTGLPVAKPTSQPAAVINEEEYN